MKKGFVHFEEAHTLLLCLLYLPIPEFVVLLIFGEGMISHLMAILMVSELFGAFVVFLLWHRCPSCHKTVAQFRIPQGTTCPYCGEALLRPQIALVEEPTSETEEQPSKEKQKKKKMG